MSQAAYGYAGDDFLQHLRRHGAHHVGVYVARRDGVHRDPLGGPFLGQGFGESVNPRFGRRVIHLAVLSGLAVDGADVHDAAKATDAHAVHDATGHVEARAEIGLYDLVPLFVVHLVHGAVAGDAGVVDQHIHRPQVRLDLGHRLFAGGEIAHIELIHGNLRGLLETAGRLLVVGVVRRHDVAGFLQAGGNGGAYATGAAGHYCDSSHAVNLLRTK